MDNGGDWIEWEGGECPVEPGMMVEVRYRPSHPLLPVSESSPARAGWFKLQGSSDWWRHESQVRTNDIIAYRVLS